ncbi:hypothetical protein D3C72_835720 [compost metagenome]
MGKQPVQSEADSLDVAFGRQAKANGGRHEDGGGHRIGAGDVVEGQAGFVVQQFAMHRVQRLHR